MDALSERKSKMSGKNQAPIVFNWQSTSPIPTLLPLKYPYGSLPSGTLAGAMASTNIIYSQILEVGRYDNLGIEINYAGTATGVVEIRGSNSGLNFYPLTFSPALTQPAGSSGGYLVNLNQFPYRYFIIVYTNTSGTGTLTAYGEIKSLS